MNWAAFFATTTCLLLGWVAYQREGVRLERLRRTVAEESARAWQQKAGDLQQQIAEIHRAALRVAKERDHSVVAVVALRADNDQLRAEIDQLRAEGAVS